MPGLVAELIVLATGGNKIQHPHDSLSMPIESESHSVVSNSLHPMDYRVHGIL